MSAQRPAEESEELRNSQLQMRVARLVIDALLKCGLDPASCKLSSEAVPSPAGLPSHDASLSQGDRRPALPMSLAGNVISLRDLETLPAGIQEVSISPRAILTPAAKDTLRSRKIEIHRQFGSPVSPQTAGSLGQIERIQAANFWVADADHPEQAAGYSRQLQLRNLSTEPCDLRELGPLLHLPGIVLSQLPAREVDRFARQFSICTVAVDRPEQAERILRTLDPQIWVIDSDRLAYAQRVALAVRCLQGSQQKFSQSRPGGPR